jgi:Arc/MetJ-type ribon-helix-helix transcriptional regulator
MNIKFASVDEAQIKQLVEDSHYTSVAEAVRFAVKKFLQESPANSPFYNAVRKGERSLREGKDLAYTPTLEDEIWEKGLARAEAG